MEIKEYLCPFCNTWVDFEKFTHHEKFHNNMDYRGMSKPNTLDELKTRMSAIGMWEERTTHVEDRPEWLR